ncbi:uncharacterized protein LOC143104866 [Alosa pseudoharengus]|uniref:uncharacterized protein LOC143104866 n=1 Tax=Alosa pseudoharengus TaxID=34774 RepID=UPI003F89DE9A
MDAAPFSRRQWASQSLRVTARELSLVGGRGKNTAIAERFSKYQKAAEEASADKKKPQPESRPSTLRSGNLSVLKKRWEQSRQQEASSTPPATTAAPASAPRMRLVSTETAQSKPGPSAQAEPAPPAAKLPASSVSSAAEQPRQSSLRRSYSLRTPPRAEKKEEKTGGTAAAGGAQGASGGASGGGSRVMERAVERQFEEVPEEQEERSGGGGGDSCSSPVSPLEKPSIPLGNLKKMFEKGESKVRESCVCVCVCVCLTGNKVGLMIGAGGWKGRQDKPGL